MIKYLSGFTKSFAILYIVWILFCVLVSMLNPDNGAYAFYWLYISGMPMSYMGNIMDNQGGLVNILLVGFFGLVQWVIILEVFRLFRKK